MVRLSLEACVPNLLSPTDIYVDEKKNRLLVKKGTQLTDHIKNLLHQYNIRYLDFPLPYETDVSPPYTFSEETETALFALVRKTFKSFQKDSVEDPFSIRKEAYDILAQAYQEFQRITRKENPLDDTPPRRLPQSVLHLRTVGALEEYLFEHAKNVGLLCLTTGYDYFREHKQRLAEIHKVAVAGLFADIGMMKIPSRILHKQDPLTEKDIALIQQHPETSAQFVRTLFRQENFVTMDIVRHHHERCDGSGYPAHLVQSQLEPYTMLLSVLDSYTSMVSKRSFRPAKNPLETLWELNESACRTYEEKAIKCLNYRVAPYPSGSVAHFAEQRLVQVVELDHIPTQWETVPIVRKDGKEKLFNIPKTIRAFVPGKSSDKLKTIPIQGHLDKLGIPMDTYDLLVLYDYAKKE